MQRCGQGFWVRMVACLSAVQSCAVAFGCLLDPSAACCLSCPMCLASLTADGWEMKMMPVSMMLHGQGQRFCTCHHLMQCQGWRQVSHQRTLTASGAGLQLRSLLPPAQLADLACVAAPVIMTVVLSVGAHASGCIVFTASSPIEGTTTRSRAAAPAAHLGKEIVDRF